MNRWIPPSNAPPVHLEPAVGPLRSLAGEVCLVGCGIFVCLGGGGGKPTSQGMLIISQGSKRDPNALMLQLNVNGSFPDEFLRVTEEWICGPIVGIPF